MFDHVLPALWMALSREERTLLAEHFELVPNGTTHVMNEEVISDGYTYEDLSGISAEKMEAFVGSSESFPRLWELTVAKARSILNPPMGVIAGQVKEVSEEVIVPKIPSHAKKNTSK